MSTAASSTLRATRATATFCWFCRSSFSTAPIRHRQESESSSPRRRSANARDGASQGSLPARPARNAQDINQQAKHRHHRLDPDSNAERTTQARLDWFFNAASADAPDARGFRRFRFTHNPDQPLVERATSPDFQTLLKEYEQDLLSDPLGNGFHEPLEVLRPLFGKFKRAMLGPDREEDPAFQHIRKSITQTALAASTLENVTALQIKYAFYEAVVRSRNGQSSKDYATMLKRAAHIGNPAHLFPGARNMRRQVHVHVGPTNSGKTYHALKRLAEARSGFYAGPLRLLAHEVYERLVAKGKRVALTTGDQRRLSFEDESGVEGPDLVASTVEMAPLAQSLEVGVIDEIQMIGDSSRGWAWTQAFLGAKVNELHVCGEPRTVDLLKQLAAYCGDDVHVHRYERLSPLTTGRPFNRDLKKLEKGDCIVCFSVRRLHELRQRVEQQTGKQCAIIYGALPPEVRATQAALFNEPNNDCDFLVASNAIGMGLNLSIRRLIFETTTRRFENEVYPLEVADVKQIAGRAGRFSSAAEDNRQATNLDIEGAASSLPAAAATPKPAGIVTTLKKQDMDFLARCMRGEPERIETAGTLPTPAMVEAFRACFKKDVSFTFLLHQLRAYATPDPRLHLCIFDDQLSIADALESVPNLRLSDRLTFIEAPINTRHEGDVSCAKAFATMVAENRPATIADIPQIGLELLEGDLMPTRESLIRLEQLYRSLVLFSWLKYKYPTVFLDKDMADHARELTQNRIQETLAAMAHDAEQYDHLVAIASAGQANKSAHEQLEQIAQVVEGGPAPATGQVATYAAP